VTFVDKNLIPIKPDNAQAADHSSLQKWNELNPM
jgi:hypothetical protein